MMSDSYQDMLAAVRAFHEKHRFRENGGEDLVYRVALMAEELGEIAECITKGQDKERLAEEVADLFILLIGTAIAADFDLARAFWEKMRRLEAREGRMVNGRIRVSEFKD
jgi:NTP pyrophosphatase (non-canonical NTP hydrolase)